MFERELPVCGVVAYLDAHHAGYGQIRSKVLQRILDALSEQLRQAIMRHVTAAQALQVAEDLVGGPAVFMVPRARPVSPR